MILRPISLTDLDAFVALSRATFVEAFGHLYSEEDLSAFLDANRDPAKLAEAIADPDVAITLAEDDGALLGYSTVYFGEGFDERPGPQPERPCVLSQLYCLAQATGLGIGAALIERAIADGRARGCTAMQLSVWSENFGAQRFYARYGFVKVADIDFWVGTHRDDEFLLEAPL
jgi:ribosomal protein S18 acetylase RimI-like enzyme